MMVCGLSEGLDEAKVHAQGPICHSGHIDLNKGSLIVSPQVFSTQL